MKDKLWSSKPSRDASNPSTLSTETSPSLADCVKQDVNEKDVKECFLFNFMERKVEQETFASERLALTSWRRANALLYSGFSAGASQ